MDCYFCGSIFKRRMKNLIRIFLLLLPVMAVAQKNDMQNLSILASKYYQDKEYDKAAELYSQLYEKTKAETYFNIYLDCLIGIPDYARAEKEIRKGIRGSSADSYWYVQWGFLKKAMGQPEEAKKMYDKAIETLPDNLTYSTNLASQFINRREFEYAEKVYLKARGNNKGLYNYELARVYYYMRNYPTMLDEYLTWADQKEENLEIIKSNLLAVLQTDNDQEISNQLKTHLLQRLQAHPEEIINNRLLIWLFIQDKNFTAAIRQALALDRRTGDESANIFNLANAAASNKNYDEAQKAYAYLIDKGKRDVFYLPASLQLMRMQYERFVSEDVPPPGDAAGLKTKFDQTLTTLGVSAATSGLLCDEAHLLAFYLDQPEAAIKLLDDGLALPGLNLPQISTLKSELSDVYVYSGKFWDAIISYSQVIESNKANSLGDDVKLRKAKLGYYMGNFKWAKAQLDVLRASTSKLIANDAMYLSLFLDENMDGDSVAQPLRIFARADWQLFRNNYPDALAELDSISRLYPSNSLEDDVDFRKAGIFEKQGKYEQAAALLDTIVNSFSSGMLADDALFHLAGIYQYKLNRAKDAMELYKKMLTDYPGSVYVIDSRNEYRKIQEALKTGSSAEQTPTKNDLPFKSEMPTP
jgi:tetratricopeptide (TPR) repeat protein